MNGVMMTALSGVQAASQRFEASAKRMVVDPNADLPTEIMTEKMAETDFVASLKVLKTADEMTKHVLDILV